MPDHYISLTAETLGGEHLCCAIADKKHQPGVDAKKQWLRERLAEGHVFRKLDAQGKVFIEYAPLESAWVPVTGKQYLYVYCLWVSGRFKGLGHAAALLNHCIGDAKRQGKSGVCALSSKTKTPFLSDPKFLRRFGFKPVDAIGQYELLALSFDGSVPAFTDGARSQAVPNSELTIYYSPQCPYVADCAAQLRSYCAARDIPLKLVPVDTLEKAKAVPCMFNNWAVFHQGAFQTHHLLNEGYLKKLLVL